MKTRYSSKSFGIKCHKCRGFVDFINFVNKYLKEPCHYDWTDKHLSDNFIFYVDLNEGDKYRYVGWNSLNSSDSHESYVPVIYDWIQDRDIIEEKLGLKPKNNQNSIMQKKYNDKVVFYSKNIGELMAAAFIFEKVTGLKMSGNRSVPDFFEFYRDDIKSGDYPIIGLKDSEFITAFSDEGDRIKITNILELEKALLNTEPIGPKINGYIGKVEDNNIVFGCAKISLELLVTAHSLTQATATTGNRTVNSITLSSGVVLSYNDINNIMEYYNTYIKWKVENK